MTAQGLFTAFMRDQHPLSSHLAGLTEVRDLHAGARRAATLEDLDEFRGERLAQRISAIRPTTPTVGRLERGNIVDDGGELRDIGNGVRVPTARYYARAVVQGDRELLYHWPDCADSAPRAVDDELLEKIGGYDNLRNASAADSAEYWRLNLTWTLSLVGEQGPWALYTHLDLTRDEEKKYRANGALKRVLTERYASMVSIVEAIAKQTDRYFDDDLPARIEEVVADRAEVLTDRSEIVRSLDLPSEWAQPPLALEEVAPTDSTEFHSDIEHDVEGPPTELDILDSHVRLSEKSFDDVLRTIRTWADAVEQNPRGFSNLDEDAISDLLAATLNATTPYAGREVYSRSGKTDIYIKADALSAGSGPARVFICESKWAKGRKTIVSALETQLFRYATAHTTSAVLLVLSQHARFEVARKNVVKWAGQASGCTGQPTAGAVDTWPILKYRVDGRLVNVCIATVWIPQVLTRDGSPK